MSSFAVVISYIFVNNLLFSYALGLGPTGENQSWKKLGIYTVIISIMLFLGGSLAWLVNSTLLGPSNLEILQTPVYLVILFIITLAYEGIGKDKNETLWPKAKDLILNSALFGGLLLLTSQKLDYPTLALSSLAAGLGYGFSLVLLKSLDSRLAKERVPRAFQGLPIRLLACGLGTIIFTSLDFLFTKGGV